MYKLKDLPPGPKDIVEKILGEDHSSITKKRFNELSSELNRYSRTEREAARCVYIHERSYAFYNSEWLDCMAEIFKGKTVLEVSSGRGLLARLMKEKGIDWIATDEKGEDWEHVWNGSFSDVLKMDAVSAVKTIECDIVFGSWFPFNNEVDVQVAESALEKNITFVFVGEPLGGCPGSKKLWDHSIGNSHALLEPRWDIIEMFKDREDCQIAKWYGCSDRTYKLIPIEDDFYG